MENSMDFSNLTKEQVEWIKKLVKESWEDGWYWAKVSQYDWNDFEDSEIYPLLEVLGD